MSVHQLGFSWSAPHSASGFGSLETSIPDASHSPPQASRLAQACSACGEGRVITAQGTSPACDSSTKIPIGQRKPYDQAQSQACGFGRVGG